MTRFAVLLSVLFIAQIACAEPASKTGDNRDIHDCPGNSKPPQPVILVTAEATVSPKIDELRKKENELNRLQAEVRQLRAETGTQQQILVRLQMLEVSLTKLRKLHTDISFFGKSSFTSHEIESLTNAIETSGSNNPADSTAKNDALPEFIKWLKENNIAKALSEPNIVMLDGRPAQLNVGGEIPIPARGDSKSAVEFRPIGTQVDIVPIMQGNNRVRLELRARVSDVDYGRSVEINGSTIPGISVRQCDTAVETEFGKSVVLNGLTERRGKTVKHDDGKTTDEIVDVALLFVVRPELVEPLVQVPPASK